MISSDRLVILIAAAHAESFAGAARRLFLTASAVSQQMQALEREVGAVLFERNRRGVRLTNEGRVLVRHAEAIVASLADAQAELGALADGLGGELRLGSFPTATADFAARAVALFQARYPRIELRFVDGEPYESFTRLKARELDLAVVFDLDSWPVYRHYDGSALGSDDDVELFELADDPYHVMLPTDHPLTAEQALELGHVRDEPIIGSSNDCAPWGSDLRNSCEAIGFLPRLQPLYQSADFQALQGFVAAGLGISLLPNLAAPYARRDIALRPLRGGPVRHVKVAFPRRSYRPPAAEAMVEILRETMTAAPGRVAGV